MSTIDPVHGSGAERWSKPARGEHFRRCSYCGSIHPEDLAAETAWSAEWADRKYGWPHKFYVDVSSRNPEALYAIGSSNGPASPGEGWVATADMTREQRKIVKRDGWGLEPGWILFGTRPSHHAKFYTAHLADPAIGQDAKDAIQRISGLRFRFEDGNVGWESWAA